MGIIYKKDRIAWSICVGILFVLPFAALLKGNMDYKHFRAKYDTERQLFDEICEQEAGEIVRESASNVRGYASLVPAPLKDYSNRNQVAPWVISHYEMENQMFNDSLVKQPYAFVEQRVTEHQFIRNSRTDNANGIARKNIVENMQELESAYGWRWRDLTTPNMREHWISGGRIEIVDLREDKVIAEAVTFYHSNPRSHRGQGWGEFGAMRLPRCPLGFSIGDFIEAVLVPKNTLHPVTK